MSLKRSYDAAVQDGVSSSSSRAVDTTHQDARFSSTQHPNTSESAPGKQRRLSFVDENGECASAPTSSRPHALPSSSRARFVPGLQTFVGGLHMSQDSSLPRPNDAPVQPSTATATTTATVAATRRSLDTSDAMQPLMMSRNADEQRRTSQSTARRRSEEALEAIACRTSLVAPEAQLVPGVSPGWHVEAHGLQAMELQDGIRFQDEDGWTPLEAFPASTRQGKLAVRRVKKRRQQQQVHHHHQHQRRESSHDRQQSAKPLGYPNALSQSPQSSSSIPTISVESAPAQQIVPAETSASTSSGPALVDVVMTEVDLAPRSGPSLESCVPDAEQVCSSPFTSPQHSSLPSSTSSSPLSTPSLTDAVAAPEACPKACELSECLKRSSFDASYSLSDFEVVETLGTGTFGRVLLVRLKHGDAADRSAYFALKVLAKSDIVKLKQVSHVQSEHSILAKVDHPFLVNMIASFQDSKNCYMLMEYVVGGEIFSYLRRAGRFSADVARFYISTIVLAIEYLHTKQVVYRDLKPENLLIDSNGYTKITDFGFAKEVQDRTWTLCGTPEYLAPEIIQCSGHGSAVDWWSLGILLFEMLAGYPPFYDPNPILIYEKILAGKLVFPKEIDPVSRDLISGLLNADRSRRLGNLRGGASDVKSHPWFHGVDWTALQEGRIAPPIVPFLGRPGDTSNFSKYEPARPSATPGLSGIDCGRHDPYADLFPDF
ncbi:probable cAMP-dependent protein kinase catalytic subunit [Sporisorium reilianum f. sp. reilianum]|uniref:cAMP-dependent protein kinase n=1 Tax=Sporisorium reilianum f. sp. reilianum TaxID=72559 RepID=A0A2N8UA80_9BASI|nr:probable cAMP-dependent protein kinase catalytic subunit [Sporisorium reilianum f. sp. reilianum]